MGPTRQKILEQFLIEKDLPDDSLVSAFEYRAAVNHDRATQQLSEQREALAEFDVSTLEGREQYVAFWINAYNFFMLDQILTQTDKPV